MWEREFTHFRTSADVLGNGYLLTACTVLQFDKQQICSLVGSIKMSTGADIDTICRKLAKRFLGISGISERTKMMRMRLTCGISERTKRMRMMISSRVVLSILLFLYQIICLFTFFN